MGIAAAVPAGAQTGDATITLSFTDAASSAISEVSEDGGAQTVRVAASVESAPDADVTVTVTVGDAGGSAAAGLCTGSGSSRTCTGDYRAGASSATVTIAAGATSGLSETIVITPHRDEITEDDETIRFTGTASSSGYQVNSADLPIADADRGIILTLSNPVMTERGDRAGGTAENVCDCRPAGAHRTKLTASVNGASSTYSSELRMLVDFEDGTATQGKGSGGDWHTEHGGDAPQVYVTIPARSVSADADSTLEFFSWVDDTAELDETFSVTVTAPDGNPLPGFTVSPADMTIVDDDAPVTLTLNQTSAAEGSAGSLTITAEMPNASRSAIGSALSFSITAQAAAGDFGADAEDYSLSATTVSIPARSTASSAVSLGLTIVDDTVVDAGTGSDNAERLSIGALSPAGLTSAVTPAILEITDNDARVALTADAVPEGGNGSQATVSASFPDNVTASHLTADTVVTLDVKAENPAGAGSAGATEFSYSPTAPNTVTIPAGSVASSVPGKLTGLTITQDAVVEGPETLLLEGTSRFEKATAAVTVQDDDSAIALSVDPGSVVESGTPREVTVTARFAGSSSLIKTSTDVEVTVAGGGGTVLGAGGDFTTDQNGDSFTVTIPAEQTSGSGAFQITAPMDDAFSEDGEKAVLSGAATVGGSAAEVTGAEITIQDPVPVTLSFTDGATSPAALTGLSEDGGAQTVRVKAAVETAPSSDLTVNVTAGATGGTALPGAGNDYVSSANTAQVVIKQGETSGLSPNLTITVADDTVAEGDETIRFTGTVADGGYGVRSADLNVSDNDDGIVLSVSPDTVVERSSAHQITVTAAFAGATSSTLAADTEVTVRAAGGAGAEGAVRGPEADFTTDQEGRAFTVVIPAAQTSGSQTFQLTARDDGDDAEGGEKVAVSGPASVGGAEITIHDPVPISLSFTDGGSSPAALTGLSEDGGAQTVRVKAAVAAAPSSDLTVNVTAGATGGTALPGAGNDYVSSADTAQVTIKQGETSGLSPNLIITVADDTVAEGDETIRFTATAAAAGDRTSSADLAINDNDDDIVLSVNPDTVVERPSANLITVTAAFAGAAASALAADTEVTVSVAGGAGEDGAVMGEGGDFTTDLDGGAFTVTIPGGQLSGTGLFRLTAPRDDASEGAEKAGVSGTASVGGRAVAVTGGELSIVDTGVRLSVTNPADGSAVTRVGEAAGAARTVRVTAVLPSGTTAGGGGVTVPFELASGTARLDSDGSAFATGEDFQVGYAGSDPVDGDGFASGITIASGKSSHYMDVTLAVNDDTAAEGSETILLRGGEVTVSDTTYQVAGSQLEITDNDVSPTIINLTLLDASDADLAGVAENSGTTKVRVRASYAGGKSLPWEVTVPIRVGVAGRADFSDNYNPCSPPQNLIEVSLGGGGTLAITGDTASSGTDYAAVAGLSVTIPAFSTSGVVEFDLSVTDDSLREGTESLTVDGDPDRALSRFTVVDDALLIYDDEQPLSSVDITLLDPADSPISQVSEGGSASVTVQLSYPGDVTLDEDRTVWVVVEEVTATYRVDYDIYCIIKRALTIPANQTSVEDSFGLITSGVYDDNIVEGDETLRVTGELAGYGFTPRILTIKDDDVRPSRIELEVSPATLAEDEEETAQSVTVTAGFPDNSAVLTSDTVVTVAVSGDAVSGEDFKDLSVDSPFSITIPAGSRQGKQEMKVTILDDVIHDDDEQIAFTGSATGFTVEGASLTITDNDPAPPNAPDYQPGTTPPEDPPGTTPPPEEPPGTPPPDSAPPEEPPGTTPPPDESPGNPEPQDDPPGEPQPPANPPVAPPPPPVNDPPPPAPPPASPPPSTNGGVQSPPARAPFVPPDPPAEEPACRGRFCDEDDSVHTANIEQIAEWRITLGCDAGDPTMFCPSGLITRRQMAAFLYRAASLGRGSPVAQEASEVSFTDVPADAWYRPYADWAVSVGSFTAPDGVFNPDGVVTRADMAVMMIAAFPHLTEKEEPDGLFADADRLPPATVRAIEGMFEAGVTRGCAAAPLRFCPNHPVTRAQMASFFVRAINLAPAETDL